MIIVDDFSTDTSLTLVQELSRSDKRIKIIKLTRNSGAAVSRNKAIEAAVGRYIAFLDSDDIWFSNKIETQINFMRDNNIPFCFSAYEKISETGVPLGKVGVPFKVGYRQLLKTCVIGCLTAVYDTDHFGKVYMPQIRKRQDFGLWLKLLRHTDFAYGIQQVLAQYRVRTDSISANKASAASYTWKLYRDVEQLNLVESSYYFSHYAVRGVLRQKFPHLARRLGVLH
ncbi:putative N-acetylgalactosaminyl-diphosphoundecaprenol glucuronosyltransferase [Marinobacterium lacunae]|uniref:Putative N-acetylgalactosaminyl-diphosphoundecaprenol glucuronosyltransferase n=1 Tax=Marinobacterium lacunae TaxID=1232683 RepID=A0A081G0C8_9GAMM|nr:putative N-acetylgalactosaminyl-diphosphoundecaprenol glucuronosyltransferase [Marinobacterium lacunae]